MSWYFAQHVRDVSAEKNERSDVRDLSDEPRTAVGAAEAGSGSHAPRPPPDVPLPTRGCSLPGRLSHGVLPKSLRVSVISREPAQP